MRLTLVSDVLTCIEKDSHCLLFLALVASVANCTEGNKCILDESVHDEESKKTAVSTSTFVFKGKKQTVKIKSKAELFNMQLTD